MIDYSPVVDWYRYRLPKSLKHFMNWQINSRVIANAVCGDVLIGMSTDLNPYTQFNETVGDFSIYMPYVLFTEKYFEAYNSIQPQDKVLAAIAMYNAFMLHEGTHVKILRDRFGNENNENKLGYFFDYFCSENKVGNKRTYMLCLNLIEDLFVWLFDEKYFNKANKFAHITYQIITNYKLLDQSKTEKDINNNLLNILAQWRNPEVRNHPIFIGLSEYIEILKKVTLLTTFDDRVEIALELYRLFDKNLSENEISNQNKNQEYVGVNRPFSNFVPEIENEFNSEDGKKLVVEIRKVKEQLEQIKTMSSMRLTDSGFDPKSIPVDYRYVGSLQGSMYSGGYRDLQFDFNKKWASLVNNLKLKGRSKTKFAMPQKQGVELMPDELYRTSTDDKVFGNKSAYKLKPRKPEVTLLLDFSGSMTELVVDVAEEAYNLTQALIQQGYNVSIYAHTTHYKSCVVIGIYSTIVNITKGSTKLRLKQALRRAVDKIDQHSNADGIAIEYVASKFSNTNTPKFLVVMSDGKPSARNYDNRRGKEHTKLVVDNLRKGGIRVLSVSLKNVVRTTNDEIYGKENNIVADKIETQMKQLASVLR